MNVYLHGTDVLGAGMIPLAQAGGPQPALVIRVKNAGQLVAKEGGKPGELAFDALPGTITNFMYAKMRDEFAAKLKEQGVNADVQVTTSPPNGPPPRSEFLPGVAVGAGVTAIAFGLWKIFRGLTR